MSKIDFSEMSNNELFIERKKMENEYEAVKAKVLALTQRLKELDVLYNESTIELNKRKSF